MQKKLPLAALALSLLLVGAGCAIGGGGGGSVPLTPVTLEYWRTDDDPETMQPIIDAYKKIHPNVEIKYVKMQKESANRNLLEAFAENRGPDLFSIPVTELHSWLSKIAYVPKETAVVTQTVNAQKKIVNAKVKTPGMTILEMRKAYVEGVTKDVIIPLSEKEGVAPTDRIFGLPFSFDTLALYYNKDLLRKANIEKPPVSWRDLQEQAVRMTILDEQGGIKQSGAALGTANNVAHYVDLLTAIMAQNGADIVDSDYGFVEFNRYTEDTRDRIYPPGLEGLLFYESFANPGTSTYTWDASLPYSLDAFVTGKTAFYFGFPTDMKTIRERAPKLDFALAPLPQIDPSRTKNIANYPVEVVSKKTAHPDEAWDFLQFAARQEQVASYLAASKRPTALRSLIQQQMTDPDVAPFVGQNLTAFAWYRGKDYEVVKKAFADLIAARPTIEDPDYQRFVSDAVGVINSSIQ